MVVNYFNVDPILYYVRRNSENSLQDISPAHGFETGTTQYLRDAILFSYYDRYVMAGNQAFDRVKNANQIYALPYFLHNYPLYNVAEFNVAKYEIPLCTF